MPRAVVYDSFPAVFYAFAPGLILAVLAPVLRERCRGSALVRAVAVAFALVMLAGFVAEALADTFRPRVFLWAATGCGALVAGILYEWSSGVPRLLSFKPLAWIGERTYGLYLGHVLVLSAMGGLITRMPSATFAVVVVAILGFTASLAVAAASWRCLEKPILGWAHTAGRRRAAATRLTPPGTQSAPESA